MTFFVYKYLLLGFLDYIFKEYSHFYTSPPSPAGFVTLTLNSGMSVYLFDILSFLSDQLHHKENMQNLANSYYDYVTNKVNSTNTITLKNSCYELFNLKPIIGFKSNVFIFIHTDHTIKIVSPIINIFNICLHNVHIIVPVIILALKPLLVTFLDKLKILLKELVNLSKISWYFLLDNIIRYINKVKIYKIILLTLDSLKKEFEIRIKQNEELGYKFKINFDTSNDFPLFNDSNSKAELDRWFSEWASDQDACKEILQTIRELENIIIIYFNSKHVEYPKHYLDP